MYVFIMKAVDLKTHRIYTYEFVAENSEKARDKIVVEMTKEGLVTGPNDLDNFHITGTSFGTPFFTDDD